MKLITLEEMMKDEGIIGKCAREFFAAHTLENVEVGKYPLSDGCKVAVSEYDTKATPKYEAHKLFIDVQLLASGKEEMRYAPLAAGKEQAPYNAEKDVGRTRRRF